MSQQARNDGRPDNLGTRLAEEVADVGRQELHEIRTDVVGDPVHDRRAALLLGAAGVTAAVSLGAATVAALRLLDMILPRRLAAVALTGGCFLSSAVLLRRGLDELERAGGASARIADGVQQRFADALRRSVEPTAATGDRPS